MSGSVVITTDRTRSRVWPRRIKVKYNRRGNVLRMTKNNIRGMRGTCSQPNVSGGGMNGEVKIITS